MDCKDTKLKYNTGGNEDFLVFLRISETMCYYDKIQAPYTFVKR